MSSNYLKGKRKKKKPVALLGIFSLCKKCLTEVNSRKLFLQLEEIASKAENSLKASDYKELFRNYLTQTFY